MTRRWAVGGVLAAAIGLANAGCDSEPPPIFEAKKIEEPKAAVVELKPPIKPAQSDEAAAKLLAEALAAHTGGKPERLAALKSCSFTRTGMTDEVSGRRPAVWTSDLIWPDRYRLRTEAQVTQDGVTVTQHQTFAMTPAGAWQAISLVQAGQQPREMRGRTPMDPEWARTLKTQMQEDAVMLLFPLADPSAVAVRGTDEVLNGKEVLGLHVWTPALDYVQLSLDEKTKLITRVVYTGREGTRPAVKEVVATEHQEFDGVKLASKLYVKANGRNLADWHKLTVRTSPQIDPKEFDGP